MTETTVGERVAALRRQRGLSQRELAAEMKRSESWVSQVERDIQPVERVGVLRDLAAALGVSVHDLRPEALPEPDPAEAVPSFNDLDEVRLALSGHPTLGRLFSPAARTVGDAGIEELAQRVDEVWNLAHASRFADLSAALTEVVPQLEDAVRTTNRDDERCRLHVVRAHAYQAVAVAFARQDEPDAAWVAADRAITAAELAGDPLDVIAGHFRLAHAFIRLRRFDQAEHVITTALDVLRPAAEDKAAAP